jgi:hypothetical protein
MTPLNKDRVRRILEGGAKLGVGILLAALTLAIIVVAVHSARNAGLSDRKDWPSIDVASLGSARFEFATMWRDDQVHYLLAVRPYTQSIKDARDGAAVGRSDYRFRTGPSFTVRLVDSGGFTIASHTVYLSSMSRIVDDAGEPQGLTDEGSFFLERGDYRRVSAWRISWSLP